MRKRLITFAVASFATASAFAYATRMMSVVKGVNASGQMIATCSFSDDDSGFVEKYGLYVVWADVDVGPRLTAWPNKRKICDVTSDMTQTVVVFPSEAVRSRVARVILGDPTYSARADGLELIDYVESTRAGSWVDTQYTPTGTASFDMMFAITNRPGKDKHATLFSARALSNSVDNATYTLFVKQQYQDGGYIWRLDYGTGAGAYTEGDLGFTHGLPAYRVRTTATGQSATMTVTKWDGVSNSAPTAGTLGTAGSTLCLFACVNVNQEHDNYAKMLCYGFRATDAGVLRLNLLPAKKTEGGTTTYGLYDTVANEFRVSGNSSYPLSAAAAVVNALDECSEAFVFENDTGAERSMQVLPIIPEGKDYARALGIAVPASDTEIPYRISAVYPDGTTRVIGNVDSNATNIHFALPPHRGVEVRKTLKVRLEPIVPDGYELLPYVHKAGSSGSTGARIDTDYKMNGASSLEAKIRFVGVPGATSAWTVFCSRSASTLSEDNPGQAGFLTWSKDSSKAYWRYDYATSNGSNTTRGDTNVVYTLKFSTPGGLQVASDTSQYIVDALRANEDFEAKGEMMLFASYTAIGTKDGKRTYSGVGNNRATDIFWLTVKDVSGDKFTLVPVKCTAEGENKDKVGFYDFVGQRFLTSSTSTPFVEPETTEKSPLVVESETFLAPEMKGLVVIIL